MNSLNYLKAILHSLKPEELTSLEKFVLFQVNPEEARFSKSVQLIKLILAEENYSANDIQKTIYGKENYTAFNKLVNRLKDKTLEVLLFDSNLQRGYYSERSKTLFELRKKMLQIDLLILKGMRNNILDDLNLVIKKSDELEIYDVLVQALYSKQRFYGLDMGAKKASQLKTQIRLAELKWSSLNASQSKFNETISKISSASSFESYKLNLFETLEFLEVEFKKTSTPTIGYYYHLLLVEKMQIEKKYNEASICLNQLFDLIQVNKSVYSEYRMGSTALNIANNFIFEKRLDVSMVNLEVARSYFVNQPLNLSILNEIEFFNLFYQGKLEDADQALRSLVKYSRSVNSPLLLNKRLFFKGCVEFINGNYVGALETLLACAEIDKDKEGWNILKKIMITLCRIELEEYESVDLKLSSLDKFIKRILKTKSIRPRYLIIIRILRKLINENFNYSTVYVSRKKYFDLFKADLKDHGWEIKSPELVIFEEWFKAKMYKKPYNHVEIMKEKFSPAS